jgi:hypothetical protein
LRWHSQSQPQCSLRRHNETLRSRARRLGRARRRQRARLPRRPSAHSVSRPCLMSLSRRRPVIRLVLAPRVPRRRSAAHGRTSPTTQSLIRSARAPAHPPGSLPVLRRT